jgi:hypothetical protein
VVTESATHAQQHAFAPGTVVKNRGRLWRVDGQEEDVPIATAIDTGELREQHIVSDLWWMPFNTAPIHGHKQIFVTSTAEELGSWVRLAASSEIERAVLVTVDDAFLNRTIQIVVGHQLTTIERGLLGNLHIYRLVLEPQ